jgi:hypothetical protein
LPSLSGRENPETRREDPRLLRSDEPPRSGFVQPLIIMPFRPDNVILTGFSGDFAITQYQRSRGVLTEAVYA